MLARLTAFRTDGLLLLVAVSWGSTYLVAKVLVGPDSVVALLAVRMLVAAPPLIALVVVRRRRAGRRPVPSRSEWVVGVVLGGLLSAVFLLETFGIAHTSATNAGVIISLTIVFTPILEAVVTRIRLPRRFFAAAAGALVGAGLLTSAGGLSAPSLGDGLVLAAALVRAAHVTVMQRLTAARENRDPLDTATLSAVQLATCAAVFAIGATFVGEPMLVFVTRLTPSDVGLLLYLALVCTVFAFFVQMAAVRRTSPTRVSLLLGTEPVWAALIGAFVAHDALDPLGWLGVVVILLSTAWGRKIEASPRDRRRPRDTSPRKAPAV